MWVILKNMEYGRICHIVTTWQQARFLNNNGSLHAVSGTIQLTMVSMHVRRV